MATLVVPTQYSTIQGAINAAAQGDTILIMPGIYNENLIINTDNLTIKASTDDVNLLGNSGSGVGIVVYSNNVTISNIFIANFDIGIYLIGSNNFVTLCLLSYNTLLGLICVGNNNSIEYSTFFKNNLYGMDLNGDEITCLNNIFKSNTLGGIVNTLAPLSNSQITNCVLLSSTCTAPDATKGIALEISNSGGNTIKQNLITADYGLVSLCQYNTITLNSFDNCNYKSIEILSDNNQITSNIITGSNSGVVINGTYNSITQNSIQNCSENAVILVGSYNLCTNNLISNTCIGIQNIGPNSYTPNSYYNVCNEVFTTQSN